MDREEYRAALRRLPDEAMADLASRCVAVCELLNDALPEGDPRLWGGVPERPALTRLRYDLADECHRRRRPRAGRLAYAAGGGPLGLWLSCVRGGTIMAGYSRADVRPGEARRLAAEFVAAPLGSHGTLATPEYDLAETVAVTVAPDIAPDEADTVEMPAPDPDPLPGDAVLLDAGE